MTITTIRIFPPIGIARVGNSDSNAPGDFFFGPEIPGVYQPPEGGYKDADCRIKRQAARFRLYAYDENDQLIVEDEKPKEITVATATITWTITLANTKGSWFTFLSSDAPGTLRNVFVDPAAVGPASREALLEIKPSPKSLTGANHSWVFFDDGTFLGSPPIKLGEASTDGDGRLIVLGGLGIAENVTYQGLSGTVIGTGYDNNYWHDDVSDGPITAKVVINNKEIPVLPAWVVVGPPNFAPSVDCITTLYDALRQAAMNPDQVPADKLLKAPTSPSFNEEILPILRRAKGVISLTDLNYPNNASTHSSFDPEAPPNAAGQLMARQTIVKRLRNPAGPETPNSDMPRLKKTPSSLFALTTTQYNVMQAWASDNLNDWDNDWPPPPPSEDITPDGLTRAALEACVGGPFWPGIEAGALLSAKFFQEPFRLAHKDPGGDTTKDLKPGDITKEMAVPWHGDFYMCKSEPGPASKRYGWWPSHRPDDVFTPGSNSQVPWVANLANSPPQMGDNWPKLGFVVPDQISQELVETERSETCRKLTIVLAKDTYSESEVATQQLPVSFASALSVIAEGFTPAELGISDATVDGTTVAPALTLTRADGTVIPPALMGQAANPTVGFQFTKPFNPQQAQRITFDYNLSFPGTDIFFKGDKTTRIELQPINITASKGADTADNIVTLLNQVTAFMNDGAVFWLSDDIRVFRVVEGDTPFDGVAAIGGDKNAALAFIEAVINKFNQLPQDVDPFADLPAGEIESALAPDVLDKDLEKPVFNFAVARVHYAGKLLPAKNVRVFFRLFKTFSTGLDYDSGTIYRLSSSVGAAVPLLGLDASKNVVSIPCFGRARVNSTSQALNEQQDDLNIRTLGPASGDEVHGYFGCWLDLNQDEQQFPLNVGSNENGPWPADSQTPPMSVKQHITGDHTCLIAEIYREDEPIGQGATCAGSPRLAQRNLGFVGTNNPGATDTRTVQHSFEFKPGPEQIGVEALPPDELMIRWHDLPAGTKMTLYLPQIEAS